MKPIHVRVFHSNKSRDAHFAPPGTFPVTEVFRYTFGAEDLSPPGLELPGYDPNTHDRVDFYVLGRAWDLLTIGHDPEFTDPPDERAVDYRARRNRRLSVGDVIGIHNRFYQSTATGWVRIDRVVIKPDEHEAGSTPYVADPAPQTGQEPGQESAA